MISKGRKFLQFNSGDLVHIISLLTSQLRTYFSKVAIKYIGPLVIYKIIDAHNFLLMTLDSKILRGLYRWIFLILFCDVFKAEIDLIYLQT